MSYSISSLSKEAISVIVLIIIFLIVPKIGIMISNSMNSITPVANDAIANAWNAAPNGVELWTQMAGIIQIAAVIMIVAIIIKSVYQFKKDAH